MRTARRLAGLRARTARDGSSARRFSSTVTIRFEEMGKGGQVTDVTARVGAPMRGAQALMERAKAAGVDIEASCNGMAACSTCHVYVQEEFRAALAEPDSLELDMLDLVASPRENSRLCCQLRVTPDCDGMVLTVPEDVNDLWDA